MGPYEPSPTALRVRTPCEASKIVTAFNQSLPIGKLPFWPTVVSAYRITIVNAATFVRPSWVWLLIGLVLIASLNPILWSPEAVQQAMSGPYPGMYYWMREIGFFALAGPIAVHWHNWVLKNDRFRWHHGFEYARRSTIYFIVLMLIVALPNETSSYLFERYFGPSASNIEPQWLKYATVAVLMLAALAITVLSLSLRLSLVLPAIALQGGKLDFRVAWTKTAGNSIRLPLGAMLTFLPVFLLISPVLLLLWYQADDIVRLRQWHFIALILGPGSRNIRRFRPYVPNIVLSPLFCRCVGRQRGQWHPSGKTRPYFVAALTTRSSSLLISSSAFAPRPATATLR